MVSASLSSKDAASLRSRAEQRLAAHSKAPPQPSGLEEALRLQHELQVHQVELEVQNEELREAQTRLNTLLEEYSILYELAPVGYLQLDANGIIRRANARAVALLGREVSALVGLAFGRLLMPASQPLFQNYFKGLQANGQPEPCEVEVQHAKAASTWISLESSTTMGKNDHRLTFVDVTQARRLSRLLKEHQAQLETLVLERTRDLEQRNADYADLYNHAPCGYHSLDSQGLITNMNDTELQMLGFTREEVVGRMNIRELFSEASRQQFERDFPIFLETGVTRNVELVLKRKDGSEFPVLVSANSQYDAQGNFIQSFSTVVDDAVRFQAQANQRARQEELEQLVVERTKTVRRLAFEATLVEERERRAIAHELHDNLGQLLYSAKLKTQLLLDAEVTEEQVALCRQLEGLLRSAILAVRSLTTKLSPPTIEGLAFPVVLQTVVEELKQGFGLEVLLEDDGAPKAVDPSLGTFFYRVVRELLINVAKHSGHCTARVRTYLQGQTLCVEVEDPGPGIEDLKVLLNRTTTHGLRIIRERITQMGGDLSSLRVPDKGWVVTLRVPLPPKKEEVQP